jgi:nucleotide-binding universal stress UspA family protein
MPKRILIGYDGTDQSVRALELCIGLFQQQSESPEFHLAYAVEKSPSVADPVPDEMLASLRKRGEEILSNGVNTIKKHFEYILGHLEFGSAPQVLFELAEKINPDLVVLGITKHPTSERILGTVSSVFLKSRRYPILGVP